MCNRSFCCFLLCSAHSTNLDKEPHSRSTQRIAYADIVTVCKCTTEGKCPEYFHENVVYSLDVDHVRLTVGINANFGVSISANLAA